MREQYNELLKKYHKAVKWLDNPKRTDEEKEEHIQRFYDILRNLSNLLEEIKGKGIQLSSKQILEGFYDN